MVAYLLIMVRSDDFTTSDAETLAEIGQAALLGDGGFVDFLQGNGVTEAQLAAFKGFLIYNPDSGSRDLRAFTQKFKNAIDEDDDGDMYEAGGFMAEIFVDAANSANIDPALIPGAHDAAGIVTEQPALETLFTSLSTSVQSSINQPMTGTL